MGERAEVSFCWIVVAIGVFVEDVERVGEVDMEAARRDLRDAVK